jgi:hypothetical protein
MSVRHLRLLENTAWPALVAAKLVFLVSLVVLVWVYLPGSKGELLLDDEGSIAPLEILEEQPELFWAKVFEETSGKLGRPLSMLTFAAEYAFLGGEASVIKRHSILLHALNLALVFYLFYLLLQARPEHSTSAWPALVAATLWSLAPQHTSTVLYAVQRMAMLSTLLVLIALIAYLQYRCHARGVTARVAWAALCFVSVSAAPFAKENGILAIPLIIVIEALWLRPHARPFGSMSAYNRLMFYALLAGVTLFVAYFFWNLDSIRAGYEVRSFSLEDRLLSQPRAIMDYARQFYWPNLDQLGAYHDDFAIGVPGDTGRDMLLLGFILLLIAAGLFSGVYGYFSGIGFAVIAYVAAHSLESGFFALEPYFEHRNYLPSVFLALVPALLLDRAYRADRRLGAPLVAWSYVFLVLLGLQTASQVKVWSNEILLSVHHLNGHPNSVRANTDMATRFARLGNYARAEALSARAYELTHSQKAARSERESDFHLRNIALACIAGAPVPQASLARLGEADPQRPLAETHTLDIMLALIKSERCDGFAWDALAAKLADVYLTHPDPQRASAGMYRALGLLAYQLIRVEEADAYVQLALASRPNDPWLLLMRLQFQVELDRLSEMRVLQDKLREMREAGKLNRSQRRTLDLYEV